MRITTFVFWISIDFFIYTNFAKLQETLISGATLANTCFFVLALSVQYVSFSNSSWMMFMKSCRLSLHVVNLVFVWILILMCVFISVCFCLLVFAFFSKSWYEKECRCQTQLELQYRCHRRSCLVFHFCREWYHHWIQFVSIFVSVILCTMMSILKQFDHFFDAYFHLYMKFETCIFVESLHVRIHDVRAQLIWLSESHLKFWKEIWIFQCYCQTTIGRSARGNNMFIELCFY